MATPFIDFRPAEVRKNKETYILYYVLDPPATNSNGCAYVATVSSAPGSDSNTPI